jgi:hypothetical protein
LSTFTQRLTLGALVGGIVSTALCAAMVLITTPGVPSLAAIPLPPRPSDEASQFRRELGHLCAALRLSIDFCERHRDSEPDQLLGQVEEMRDGICAFINQAARPVRLLPRSGSRAGRAGSPLPVSLPAPFIRHGPPPTGTGTQG